MKQEIENVLNKSRVVMSEEQKQFLLNELEVIVIYKGREAGNFGYLEGYKCAMNILQNSYGIIEKKIGIETEEKK